MLAQAVLDFEEGDAQVRFDEAARRLVLIKHKEFVAMPLAAPAGDARGRSEAQQVIRCENRGKVENVRFSLNHRFVAVQRSDVELELLDLLLGNAFTHLCKGGGSKQRWRILNFQWTGTPVADFLVVTTAGIELYLVLPDKKALKLVKRVEHAVAWCVYSHPTRLVMLATGAHDNIMHGLQVQPQAIVRIPKFEVQLAPPLDASGASAAAELGQQKASRSLLPSQLHVVRLYNAIYCVHVEPERRQLLLYQLFKDFVVRKCAARNSLGAIPRRNSSAQFSAQFFGAIFGAIRSRAQFPTRYALNLYATSVAVSVSDNLLLVHSLEAKVVLIFDLKINTQFPISAPLPLATLPLSRWPAVYTPHWVLAAPDVVIDPQMGVVGILKPDLAAVAHSSIDKECLLQARAQRGATRRNSAQFSDALPSTLLQFLLARSNAHDVVLDVLARAVRDAEPLPVIARCFDLVCAAAANAVLRRRALLEGPSAQLSELAIASPRGFDLQLPGSVGSVASPPPTARSFSAIIASASPSPRASDDIGTADDAATEADAAAAVPATRRVVSEPAPSTAAEVPEALPTADDDAAAGAAADGEPRRVEAHLVSDAPAAAATPPAPTTPAPGEAEGGAPSADHVYNRVFVPLVSELPSPPDARCARRRRLIASLCEWLHAQQQHMLPPDDASGALLLALLAEQKSYFQLHQFVQYHVVADSALLAAQARLARNSCSHRAIPLYSHLRSLLASQLLELEEKYPPAAELALDMLRRLGAASNETVMGHLLAKGDLLGACRFIRHQRLLAYPARTLLAAAAARDDDPSLFAAVYSFFQQRNEVWRGSAAFLPEEGCDEYVGMWEERARVVPSPARVLSPERP